MILAVIVGMSSEAAIIPPGAAAIVGAGDAAALSAKLEAAIAAGADRVLSVGICGGINRGLQVGDVLIGVNAVYGEGAIVCDPAWRDRLFDALTKLPLPPYRVSCGRFTWSPTAVGRMVDKAALRAATGADVVDEETFLAGSIAAAHGLPWAALRVVSDAASFELPAAAVIKLTAAGADDIGAILASIAGDPWQIPELFELAGSTATALGNLRAALARIGPDFAAT